MKPRTIPHYKVHRFIEENFQMEYIDVSPYDENSLLVKDRQGGRMVFRCEDGEVNPYEFSDEGSLVRFQYPPGHPCAEA